MSKEKDKPGAEVVPLTTRILALTLLRGMKFTISLLEKALRGEKL